MKVKDLIQVLQKLNPKGDMDITLGMYNRDITKVRESTLIEYNDVLLHEIKCININ